MIEKKVFYKIIRQPFLFLYKMYSLIFLNACESLKFFFQFLYFDFVFFRNALALELVTESPGHFFRII